MLEQRKVDEIILSALNEDMPMGDITTDNIIDPASVSRARFIAKQDGVIACVEVAKRAFQLLDPNVVFFTELPDGTKVSKGDIILEFEGNTAAMLKAERTALNIIQRMSGVATRTYGLCSIIADLDTKIVDTRKTTPGLRYLEKYAVRVGGGQNHRYCLSDGVLIKDNHIKAAGGILNAVSRVRKNIPHTIKIEVETENFDMVREALEAGADIIMLDNMSVADMAEAVKIINGKALVEASGDMDEEKVRAVAETGVDIISVGKITHSVKAMDISMRF